MKRKICVVASLVLAMALPGCASRPHTAGKDVSHLLRLYDFTGVSVTNPVVARVPDCGIEIPTSELRAYVDSAADAPPPSDKPSPLTLDQKRAKLEMLLDEHFLMWTGYQKKADQSPEVMHMLEFTKVMLLRETLVNQEVGRKAKTPQDYQRLYKQLCDRIFDQTKITVSNEGYDDLKKAAGLLDSAADAPSVATNTFSEAGSSGVDKLAPAVRNRILADCKIGYITVGDFLAVYLRVPADQRPDLGQRDGVVEILRQMLRDGLLTSEARERGLAKAPMVQEKMQLNRNMMVRMYALNQITAESMARIQEPGQENQVKQWYERHLKDRYTYRDDSGVERIISYDQQRERVESDYLDDLREQLRTEQLNAIRKEHKVEIDEKALEQAVL